MVMGGIVGRGVGLQSQIQKARELELERQTVQPKKVGRFVGRPVSGVPPGPHRLKMELLEEVKETGLTITDFNLAMKGYTEAGFSETEADRMARADITTQAEEIRGRRRTEEEITRYIGEYPGAVEEAVGALGERLGEYQERLFEERLIPRTMQQLGAVGRLDSGALNVAMAESAGRLSREREAQLAPLLYQGAIGGQQMQYADLLRRSAEAGVALQAPSSFYQQFYQPAYGGYQAGLGREFQAEESELQRSFQRAMTEQAYSRQLAGQRGALTGMGIGTLGAGLLTAAGGYGFTPGALMGLTGQYPSGMLQRQQGGRQ